MLFSFSNLMFDYCLFKKGYNIEFCYTKKVTLLYSFLLSYMRLISMGDINENVVVVIKCCRSFVMKVAFPVMVNTLVLI